MILKKRSRKQNLVRPGSFSNSKLVFILLTKVIILYIKLIAIDVRRPSFKFIPK